MIVGTDKLCVDARVADLMPRLAGHRGRKGKGGKVSRKVFIESTAQFIQSQVKSCPCNLADCAEMVKNMFGAKSVQGEAPRHCQEVLGMHRRFHGSANTDRSRADSSSSLMPLSNVSVALPTSGNGILSSPATSIGCISSLAQTIIRSPASPKEKMF